MCVKRFASKREPTIIVSTSQLTHRVSNKLQQKFVTTVSRAALPSQPSINPQGSYSNRSIIRLLTRMTMTTSLDAIRIHTGGVSLSGASDGIHSPTVIVDVLEVKRVNMAGNVPTSRINKSIHVID